MATARQSAAARRNIKKAAQAARRKRTIAHLPKSTRTALGKQASRVAKAEAKQRLSQELRLEPINCSRGSRLSLGAHGIPIYRSSLARSQRLTEFAKQLLTREWL
jgi:hypothetical protein